MALPARESKSICSASGGPAASSHWWKPSLGDRASRPAGVSLLVKGPLLTRPQSTPISSHRSHFQKPLPQFSSMWTSERHTEATGLSPRLSSVLCTNHTCRHTGWSPNSHNLGMGPYLGKSGFWRYHWLWWDVDWGRICNTKLVSLEGRGGNTGRRVTCLERETQNTATYEVGSRAVQLEANGSSGLIKKPMLK